jgi:hypothetical protein
MQTHWEIAWSTLRPLGEAEVERSVRAIARLGCASQEFIVEAVESRYVAIRHRATDEFLLEFGFAEDAPGGPALRETIAAGLVNRGHIAWNWCCTARRRPETGLVLFKFRQVQEITGDKLLVWDDDGMCHWSWGSCTLEQAALQPLAVVDAHLHGLHLPHGHRLAS